MLTNDAQVRGKKKMAGENWKVNNLNCRDFYMKIICNNVGTRHNHSHGKRTHVVDERYYSIYHTEPSQLQVEEEMRFDVLWPQAVLIFQLQNIAHLLQYL